MELFAEHHPHRGQDVLDEHLEIGLCLFEVLLLRGHIRHAMRKLFKFLDGVRVDGAQRADLFADALQFPCAFRIGKGFTQLFRLAVGHAVVFPELILRILHTEAEPFQLAFQFIFILGQLRLPQLIFRALLLQTQKCLARPAALGFLLGNLRAQRLDLLSLLRLQCLLRRALFAQRLPLGLEHSRLCLLLQHRFL